MLRGPGRPVVGALGAGCRRAGATGGARCAGTSRCREDRIGLDPLAPGNISYLLWLILGYVLVSAVLVIALGRLGDIGACQDF
jgi:hypothetical protein